MFERVVAAGPQVPDLARSGGCKHAPHERQKLRTGEGVSMSGERISRNCRSWTAGTTCIPSATTSRSASAARGSSPAARACTSTTPQGHQILDGMSGLWCVNLGYGRRELIEAAYQQLQTLPYYNSFFQCAHRAGHRARNAALGGRAAVLRPRLLHQLGLRGERHHHPHGAPLLGHPGQAEEEDDHQPQERLPRQHDRRHQPRRHAGAAGAGRPADSRHRAHRATVLVRAGSGHAPGRVRAEDRRRARAQDRGARRRQRRGVHRRAGAGRRRRDHPAGHLLAGDPAHLRRVRHPAGRRRGHHRLRAARRVVRLAVLRHRARSHHLREGREQRLPAARRRAGRRARGRGAGGGGRRVLPRLHALR